jgi:simple sugar transport system ATP-binding protein
MADGILPTLSVAENLVLGLHRHVFTGHLGYDPGRAVEMAAAPIAAYRIAPPSATAMAGLLSGGNIQKILIARALARGARTGTALLLAHNPSRGLDIRTTTFVRRCLVEASRAGAGVLLVSSDLDELLQIADRILVMFHGALVADLSAEAFDPYRIGRLMAGGGEAG